MHTRQVAERPVRLSFPHSRLTRRLNPAPMPLFGRSGEERTSQRIIPISSESTSWDGVRVIGKLNRLDQSLDRDSGSHVIV